jgi:hypothetical protein
MTNNRIPGDVLLVGSLPFETAEESLRKAATLGSDVNALPDGEVGDRRFWVTYLAIETYAQHPDLIETRAPTKWEPQPDDEGLPGAAREFHWTFQIKPGVKSFDFNGLGYVGPALESYKVFTKLRDEGAVAPGVRFQISLPGVASALHQFFDDYKQWPTLHAAYVRAIATEIGEILKTIPAQDLAIQFDMAWEVNDLSIGDETYLEYWPDRTYDEKFQAYTDLVVQLPPTVPDEIPVGFHWCYGTWGGWPMTGMDDVQLCVDLSNATVPRSGRLIDYVHMPVTLDPGQQFFLPLKDLDIGDTKVYLGLVHHEDGINGSERRIALAKESLPEFGVAAVCGYGREDPEEVGDIFALNSASAHAVG